MVLVVILAVLPVTITTVVQFEPSVLIWMLKSLVFQPVFSPPAPACCSTKRPTLYVFPRSTCNQYFPPVPPEHHLLSLITLPSTALSGVSAELQELSAVVVLYHARFALDGA